MQEQAFDFAILKDGKISGLVEFQGKQHFEPIDFFGGVLNFESQKRRDQIKRDYCKDKVVPLLEIHYNEVDKIPKILDKFLQEVLS